ncbi:MAG: hypothetical protein QG644_445, partial [Patescibacteria group bacterium]|nr:hypothetical protein [Patescibacteria group bacterium]
YENSGFTVYTNAVSRFSVGATGGISVNNTTITDTGVLADINLTLGNDAAADTISALNIDVTSAATGADGDILYGINVANLTSADADVAESAIRVGTGWDNILDTGALDISQAGVISGATGITSSGTITFGSMITDANAVLYTTTGGVVTRVVETETGSLCLLSGAGASGVPTWGSCGGGALSDGDYGDIVVSGTGTAMAIDADVVDWDNIIDSMTVDAATDINLGANALSIDLDSTGDFSIRDVTTDIATFADSGAITFAPTSGQSLTNTLAGTGTFTVNSGVTTGATTASALALNANSLTTGTGLYAASSSLTSGSLIDLQINGTAAIDNQKGLNIQLAGTNSTSTQTTYGAYIVNGHAGTGAVNNGLYVQALNGANNTGGTFDSTFSTASSLSASAGVKGTLSLAGNNAYSATGFSGGVTGTVSLASSADYTYTSNHMLSGILSTAYLDGAGTTADSIASARIRSLIYNTAAVTDLYNIFIESPDTSGSGTVTTAYGIRIGAQEVSGVTTGWGVYQAGASDSNYFAGTVGIGSTTLTSMFNVGTAAQFQVNSSGAIAAITGISGATGVYDLGGATSFEIPNSATPTVDADGEIAFDTTVTDFSTGLFRVFGNEEQGLVSLPVAEFTTPSNGDVIAYNATTDEFELVTAGSLITADSLDFDDFVDSMTVDAATDINLGANALSIDLDSTGDFSIRDVTTDIATFADTGRITLAPTAGQNLTIAFTSNNQGRVEIGAALYTSTVGAVDIIRGGNFTATAGSTAIELGIQPALTVTEPGSGTFTWNGADIDMASLAVTAGAGTSVFNSLRLAGVSDADAGTVRGLLVDNITGTAASETGIEVGTGWDLGINMGTTGLIGFGNANHGIQRAGSGKGANDITVFTTSGELVLATDGISGRQFAITNSAGDVDISGAITAGSGNEVITLSTGKIDADAITLVSSGTTGSTSSRSGLQTSANGLSLIMGCADNELLKWTDASGWACATDTSGGSPTWDAIGSPVADQALTFDAGEETVWTVNGTTATNFAMNANALTSGTILSLTSAGTAAASGQTGLNIALSGVNGTASQTSYGLTISNTHTGTTPENYGALITATGAGQNYGISVNASGSAATQGNTAGMFTNGGAGTSFDPVVIFDNSEATGYTQVALQGTGRTWSFGVGNASEAGAGVADDFFIYDYTGTNIPLVINTAGEVLIGEAASQGAGFKLQVTNEGVAGEGGLLVEGNAEFLTADDAYASFDDGNARLGFTKKSGSGPKVTYGSATTFTIAQSSGTTIEETNTFTDKLTLDGTGNLDIAGALTAGSGNTAVTLGTGMIDADAITLISNDGAGLTTSDSGLETTADGLGLLQGCSDTQILKWDETNGEWDCAADATGGGGVTADSLDFTELSDTMTLDASTSIAFGASTLGLTFTNNGSGNETHNLSSTGDFIVQDNGVNALTVDDSGNVTLGQASTDTGQLVFANSSNANTVTLQAGTTGGNITWTLPTADSAGCFKSDGAGTMSIGSCGDTKVEIYDTNSTYTVPTDAQMIIVEAIGGGGSGGGGALGNIAQVAGGGGGGGGAYTLGTFTPSELGGGNTVLQVTRGAGGASPNLTVDGNSGGTTCISTSASCGGTVYQRAYGGGGGSASTNNAANAGGGGGGGGGSLSAGNNAAAANRVGGTGGLPGPAAVTTSADGLGGAGGATGAGAGASGGNSGWGGAGGGASSTNGSATTGTGGNSTRGGAGGGGGASCAISPCGTARIGQVGGTGKNGLLAGGTGGTAPGGDGGAGTNSAANSAFGGAGGGGGGSNNAASGVPGDGGAGGVPGGGGGGGGTAINNTACAATCQGTGGAGGNGRVRITTLRGAGADLAEMYATNDEDLKAGDVVAIDPELNAGVKKSEKAYDSNVIGVISTDPGLTIGNIDEDRDALPVLVALTGRVPVKVSLENGPIRVGDALTASTVPGVAMKATKAGVIIGQALTKFEAALDEPELGDATYPTGYVMMFIKNSHFNGTKLVELLPGLEPDVAPPAEEVALDEFGNPVIPPEGSVPEDNLQDVETPELVSSTEIGKLALTYFLETKQELLATADFSEVLADRVSAGLEMITPTLIADNVSTNRITTSTGSDINVILGDDEKFIIGSSTSTTNEDNTITETITPTVTFDNLGNAIFAGTITADKISANEITGLSVITNQLSTLADTVTGLTGQAIDLSGIAVLATDVATLKTSVDALNVSSLDATTRLSALEANAGTLLITDALLNTLTISSITTISGGLVVDNIKSIGELVNITSDVEFFGTPYFTKDTAGFAVIEQGAKEVSVVFDKPYLAQPIVNATITLEDAVNEEDVFNNDIRYVVTRKTPEGFTILLNKNATSDIRFSWSAFAVRDASVTFSIMPDILPPEPDSIDSPPADPTPEPTPTPDSTGSPQAEPTPLPNPEPDSTPTGDELPPESMPEEPAPEPQPEADQPSAEIPTGDELPPEPVI